MSKKSPAKEAKPGAGHNSIAQAKLRSYFESIERLNEEIEALNSDKSNVYASAKAEGFDTKIMRIVLSRRKMDRAEVKERDVLIELYENALSDTNCYACTRAREGVADDDA